MKIRSQLAGPGVVASVLAFGARNPHLARQFEDGHGPSDGVPSVGRQPDWNDASRWDGRKKNFRVCRPTAGGAAARWADVITMECIGVQSQTTRTPAIGPAETNRERQRLSRLGKNESSRKTRTNGTMDLSLCCRSEGDGKKDARHSAARPSSRPLGRRSGRFPPLPYPPPSPISF